MRIQFIMGGSVVPRIFLPKMIEWYYQNYFYDRKDIMDYPVTANGNEPRNLGTIDENPFGGAGSTRHQERHK